MNYSYFDVKCPIYIPAITKNWANKKKIKDIFEKLQIGIIDRIYIRKNGYNNYKAFIYFKTWFDTLQNRNIQSKMFNPKLEAKLVYDDPNYWVLLRCKNPRTSTEIYLQNQINALKDIIILQQDDIYKLQYDINYVK